jgi:hypothetical protein
MKKRKTEGEKKRQRIRTHSNKVLKYKKLLAGDSKKYPHKKVYQEKLEYSLNQ